MRTPNKARLFKAMEGFINSNTAMIAVFKEECHTLEQAKPVVIEFASLKTGCDTHTKNGVLRLSPDNKKAYDRARQVVSQIMTGLGWGKSKRGSPAAKTVARTVKVNAATRSLAMAFLGNFSGKTLDAQIAQAVAVLKAMK